jgi:hypothetical protein
MIGVMSHGIMVPISAQGTILDPNIDSVVPALCQASFGFTDVFIYSHGWWTTADAAMIDYTQFSVGFAATVLAARATSPNVPTSSLEIGVHWPSMISDNSGSLLNLLEPFSFYNCAKMADDVGEHGGYALVRLILEARQQQHAPQPRFHFIGHSFGCKIVCSALEAIATDSILVPLLNGLKMNVVLLQGAFDNDSFEAGQDYADVIPGIPGLRLLATRSSLDAALCKAFVDSEKLVNLFSKPVPALGAQGPSPTTFNQLNGINVTVGLNYVPPATGLGGHLVVADLTPLHQDDNALADPLVGHHSDIYHEEIYRLIAAFLFQ